MRGLNSLLGFARDGLAAYSGAIATTGQNIAGADTPGYVRRRVGLHDRATGGVEFRGAIRSFDRFAYSKVVGESGKRGAASYRLGALETAEGIVAPPSGGINDRLNAFFSAAAGLSASPADPSTRQVFLARANDVASSFSDTASQISTLRADLLGQGADVARDINSAASQVAKLNTEIASTEAQGGDASSLRDTRDGLIKSLGEKFGARSIENDKGEVTVFAGGTAIVEGNQASAVRVGLDASGAMKFEVVRPGGTVLDVTSSAGGALAGLREARDVDLVSAQQGLDQLASDFTSAVNAVHAAGVGLDGGTGRPLFVANATVAGSAYNMKVDPAVAADPRLVAASATNAGLPGNGDVARRMQALASSTIGAGGTPSDYVASWAGGFGARKQSAQEELDLREGTVQQSEMVHASRSGVSIDEEMVDLSRYQRAFEAQTKVLRTADELLQGLLQELG